MAQVAWEFYLKKSREAVARFGASYVLKCDANNEAFGHPCHGGIAKNLQHGVEVTLIDCSVKALEAASLLFPSMPCIQGDIRELPFADNSFDLIIDASTIDHVPSIDVAKVIDGYARVAPYLLLVSWLTKEPALPEEEPWRPGAQYFFRPHTVEEPLKKHYDILETDKDFYVQGLRYLGYYLCQRKDISE